MDIQEKNLSEEYVNFVTLESLPNAIRLDEVREASLNDQTIQTAILYTRTGRWYQMKDLLPENGVNLEELTAIRSVRDELTVHSDNVLLRNNRIVLPQTLRRRAVQVSHEGHQGMATTKAYLRSKVWFPGMDGAVENSVKNCVMSVTYPRTACDGTVKDVRITWECLGKSQYGFLWTVTK